MLAKWLLNVKRNSSNRKFTSWFESFWACSRNKLTTSISKRCEPCLRRDNLCNLMKEYMDQSQQTYITYTYGCWDEFKFTDQILRASSNMPRWNKSAFKLHQVLRATNKAMLGKALVVISREKSRNPIERYKEVEWWTNVFIHNEVS